MRNIICVYSLNCNPKGSYAMRSLNREILEK